MIYNDLVMDCFLTPKHVGVVTPTIPVTTYTAYYRSGVMGQSDVVDWYLACEVSGLVQQAFFKAYGNPYLIAAAELICRSLAGEIVYEHPRLDYVWLLEKLAIPAHRAAVAYQVEDGYKTIVSQMQEQLRGIECLK